MTSNMRKRYDVSADPAMILEYAVDLATVIEIGDLVWLDTDDAKPFNATELWTGTEAGSLGKAAEKFIGSAMSAHAANDARVTTIRVATIGVFAYPLNTATTLEMGDLVGAKKDTGNTLLNQVVAKVTNESHAIGRVVRRGTLVTIARFDIRTRAVAGGGNRAFLTS